MYGECIQDQCMMWSAFQKSDDSVYETCCITFIPVLLSQMITEQTRGQASSDKVANEVRLGFDSLLNMAAQKRLNG